MFGSAFGSVPLTARCVRCDGTGTLSPPCATCGGSLAASAGCPICQGRRFTMRSCPVCRGTGRDPALEANSRFGTDRLSQGSAYVGERRAPKQSFLASVFAARQSRDGEGRRGGGENWSPTLSYRPSGGGSGKGDGSRSQGYGGPGYGSGYAGTGGKSKCYECDDTGRVVRDCRKCGGDGKVGKGMCSNCLGMGDERVDCTACR
jgi:hypothetical protein